jgi:phosphopantothenoylcysteine decarboxylase/phosphopantothenate--cysteine ligase
MLSLMNKRVILGVTGSIAAYKAAELVRRLRAVGAEVQVVMSRGAMEFVMPLTFQSLSGHPVRSDLMDTEAEAGMGHIELARWADTVLVAPASADFIARLAQGRADDLLTTLCLATQAPVAVAPAMNRVMWENPASQSNIRALRSRQVVVLGPAQGEQACGETGSGRLLEPGDLVQQLAALFATGSLAGLNVLVTAGPTREPIDPVRYISNHSSGRMGYALAQAAVEAGARVTLVSGPVTLSLPERLHAFVAVQTAEQMLEAVMKSIPDCHIMVAAAAVADYRPARAAGEKQKRREENLQLDLVPNPDVLAQAMAVAGDGLFSVGFAAETNDLHQHARDKLQRKGVDMLVANRVGWDDDGKATGFNAEENQALVLWRDGEKAYPLMSKPALAREIVQLIAERYHAKTDTTENPGQSTG